VKNVKTGRKLINANVCFKIIPPQDDTPILLFPFPKKRNEQLNFSQIDGGYPDLRDTYFTVTPNFACTLSFIYSSVEVSWLPC
jgi:hypothetical protein